MASEDTLQQSPGELLASLMLGQDVHQWVRDQRAQGVTWRKIGRNLTDATHGKLDVHETTLRRWAEINVTS